MAFPSLNVTGKRILIVDYLSRHISTSITDERVLARRSDQSFHSLLVSRNGWMAAIATYPSTKMVSSGFGDTAHERD
jgi:hypothetical protein